MIAVGDFYQLSPVNGHFMFMLGISPLEGLLSNSRIN